MTPYQFLYKVVSLLLLNDNSFVYPLYDRDTSELKALYPLNPMIVEPIVDKSETYYLKFHFESGESFVLPKENVIHLRRFYTGNDVFGGSGSKSSHKALLKTLGINDALASRSGKGGIQFFPNQGHFEAQRTPQGRRPKQGRGGLQQGFGGLFEEQVVHCPYGSQKRIRADFPRPQIGRQGHAELHPKQDTRLLRGEPPGVQQLLRRERIQRVLRDDHRASGHPVVGDFFLGAFDRQRAKERNRDSVLFRETPVCVMDHQGIGDREAHVPGPHVHQRVEGPFGPRTHRGREQEAPVAQLRGQRQGEQIPGPGRKGGKR